MIKISRSVKEGQIYEVTFSNGKTRKYAVTAVDEEPDTHTQVCFLISDKGIGQVSYCEDLLENSKLLLECDNWKEAVNTSVFDESRVLQ